MLNAMILFETIFNLTLKTIKIYNNKKITDSLYLLQCEMCIIILVEFSMRFFFIKLVFNQFIIARPEVTKYF